MMLLVLAGGFGTRLQSAVTDVPKALAPVGDVPFLKLQIEHWKKQGVNSFIFLLHHQADLIVSFLKMQQVSVLKDCEVHWVIEPRPMDTGGAVAYAIKQLKLKGNFLVTNADTWLGSGFAEMGLTDTPAMAVLEVSDTARYGRVQFNSQRLVTSYDEKNNSEGIGWINAGLYSLSADLFKEWDYIAFSLERLTFPAMVAHGYLKAVTLQADFIDIGVPDEYYRFCRWIEANREGNLCY